MDAGCSMRAMETTPAASLNAGEERRLEKSIKRMSTIRIGSSM